MSDMDNAYRRCLKLEADRERKHRTTAKATTGANALHYEATHVQGAGVTTDFGFDVSDKGEGAEAAKAEDSESEEGQMRRNPASQSGAGVAYFPCASTIFSRVPCYIIKIAICNVYETDNSLTTGLSARCLCRLGTR